MKQTHQLSGNFFTRLKKAWRMEKRMRDLRNSCDFEYSVLYNKNKDNALLALCDKYGSDKGEISPKDNPYVHCSHTYADFLYNRFNPVRNHITKVFECGIGLHPILKEAPPKTEFHCKPGASLRVWRDYFPNAVIHGADINKDLLFEEDRIKTHYLDQTDKNSVQNMWREINATDFDLIIDDGLHKFDAGICLFENSIDFLADGGTYIIEDVTVRALVQYKNYFKNTPYNVEFVNLYRPNAPLSDNSLVVIRKQIKF